MPNPYSEASTQVAAIQNPYSPSGQVVQQQTVNGLSARTTSMAAEPEIPTNLPPTSIADLEARTPGFPEPFELPKSSGVTLKTASLKSAAVTTQNLVPEPFLPRKGMSTDLDGQGNAHLIHTRSLRHFLEFLEKLDLKAILPMTSRRCPQAITAGLHIPGFPLVRNRSRSLATFSPGGF
ncbi:MAG: hypothetical protein H6624_18260 [Bdellovibrionaceae bacterium]|nr:hypothetical protein [Pseudobdellovibrionaceae bacterium]